MDIYLLNDDFQIVKIIDDFFSLIWRRKYNEPGDFELHCVHTLFAEVAAAKYVYCSDRSEVGVIENYGLNIPFCFCKGRFLECLLADKIIYPAQSFSSKTQEYIVRNLIATFLPDISLGTVNSPEIGSQITTQVTGDNLMEYIYDRLVSVDASYSLTCILGSGQLTFSVWKGTDRSTSAIFSQEWDNLKSFSYEYSDKDYKNYAIVAGEGESSARQFVAVDHSDGGRRREIFVDARDLQQGDSETAQAYAARLALRGEEKLAQYEIKKKGDAEIDTESSLRYREDFDLGDVCTIKDDQHGVICRKRITECEEVYENGSFTLSVVFGEGYLLLPKYLERKLK